MSKPGGINTKDVEDFLRETVQSGDTVLAAVSGGADSMVMLSLLLEVRETLGIRVEVVHIHHHLRAASDAEWQFVENFCTAHGVPFHGRHIDVPGAQARDGHSMEATAHRLRYNAFREVMADCGAQWIALAHHANDRAETLLMNLLRGTSGHGLAAMSARNGAMIRPLLSFTREDIEAYGKAKGMEWVNDESNNDTTILRNRLRHELLPTLASYNPNIVGALNRLAESSEWEQDYIDASAQALYEQAVVFYAKKWCLLERAPLLEAHKAVVAALLRARVEKMSASRHALRFEMIEQVLLLLQEGHGRYDLGDGVLFECTGRYVYIGEVPTGEWRRDEAGFSHEFLEARLEGMGNTPLAVRFPQSGDVVFLEKVGHKRLKKIFQEKGLPSVLRGVWPLIYDIKTKEVIWVPFLARTTLLMYYNSVTFSEVNPNITIAGQSERLTF